MKANNSTAWVQDLIGLLELGTSSSPRGIETRELLGFISYVDMSYPIIVAPGRNLGYKFMAAEAAWILGGDDTVAKIQPYSRLISNFSDNGETFFGAYGPKIASQFDHVVNQLSKDQDTRQAVINIWRENPPASKDIPCTISVQWLIRGGKLYCLDNMRSSDIWLGHPYDIFNFSVISAAIAIELRNRGVEVELGTLILTAGSKHIYSTNFEAAEKVISNFLENPKSFVCGPELNPKKFENKAQLENLLWELAASSEGAQDADLWA